MTERATVVIVRHSAIGHPETKVTAVFDGMAAAQMYIMQKRKDSAVPLDAFHIEEHPVQTWHDLASPPGWLEGLGRGVGMPCTGVSGYAG